LTTGKVRTGVEPTIATPYTSDIKENSSADKSLACPGKKQATATEDFDVHLSYL